MMNDKKLTRQEKKEIKAVIEKWVPEKFIRNLFPMLGGTAAAGGMLAGGTVGLVLGSVVDLILTGGIGTIALASAGGLGVVTGAPFAGLMFVKGAKWKNAAGQKIYSNLATAVTLLRMEQKLSKLFNEKSHQLTVSEVQERQQQIDTIYNDVKTIKPMYNIIDTGKQNETTLSFVFTKVADLKQGTRLEQLENIVPKEFRQKPKKLGK